MTTVIAQDFHGQFRDKKTCNMFFNFLKREKPDRVVLPGDIVDFYSISRFDKDPARKEDLQDELNDGYNLLYDIRDAAGDARIDYIQGNHEKRLEKYLCSTAKALATLDALKIELLLGFADFDITYHKEGLWLGDLYVYHGSLVRNEAGYTAKAEREKNGCSGMSGHTHRDGKSAKRTRGGQICWWENFCMCDLEPEYVDGVANWTQGWSVVTTIGKRPMVEQVAVLGGRYLYRGKEYTS
jgi:predicted phosphodiesterase